MAAKLKIVYLISEISDGGAETLVKDYVSHLDHNIFDIYIITDMESDTKSANYRTLYRKGIKIYCPFINSGKGLVNFILFQIQNKILRHTPLKIINKYKKWYIKHLILRIKPNIIHSHMMVLKYLVPCAKKIDGVKLFYTCHSLPHRYFNNNECKEELDAANFLIKNYSLTLIGLHREMQSELNKLFSTKSTIIIRNGINLDKFRIVKKNKDKKSARKDLRIPQDAFVLGHVGRFTWIKNQSFIIDIFQELSNQKNNTFLLLVGSGDSSEISHKLDQNGLKGKYLILSNRQDIPEILLCMDAFVFPSLFEGLPLACIEAQAMSLRSFISDTVTKDVFFTPNAIPLSLNQSALFWANAILDSKIQGPYINNIDDFDLKKVLANLYKQYLQ